MRIVVCSVYDYGTRLVYLELRAGKGMKKPKGGGGETLCGVHFVPRTGVYTRNEPLIKRIRERQTCLSCARLAATW